MYRYVSIWIVSLLFLSPVFAFTDIQDHPYAESILYLQDQEIIKGYPDGSFGPNRGVTRAEMLKIILKAYIEEDNLGNKANCFPDVDTQRFAPYVCYAQQQDIIKGYPDGTFQPDKGVSIAEGLKIALKTFEKNIQEGTDARWFEPYVDFVHNNSLFSKYALRPEQPMTRAQISFLVHQLLLEKQGEKIFTGNRDARSPGCFTNTPPSKPPTSSMVNGIQRSYITDIGKNYNHQTPTRLIFAFHGRTNPNTQVRGYYGLEKQSDGNAIFVYPSGLPEQGPTRSRSNPGDPSDQLRGFALFDTLLKEFSETYCVDMDQVFVVGHSLGARFTNSLSCARGDVIRATGSVGGSTTINECSGPVAAIIMHNPKDRLASFSGGITARDQLLKQNACGPETKSVGPPQGNCVEYTNCTNGAPVIRCPHTQDTARWDGSYYPHTRPDFAGKQIMEFIEDQQ